LPGGGLARRQAAALGPLLGANVCSFAIVLMPEGKGDMGTIPAKKSCVYTDS